MHFQHSFLGLAIASFVSALGRRDDANSTSTVDNRFIIEFSSTESEAAFNQAASKANIQVLKTFKSDIFNGVSVLADKHNSDALGALAGVSNVWPMQTVYLSEPIGLEGFSDDATAGLYDIHGSTGVDKLHAAGIYGEGAVIGIVDTGVYYPHPALGGGFGPGFKISGGYDLVGEDWPYAPKAPDNDPLDSQGHGTHVAGIAVGQSDKFTGVAPKANVRSYKVFGSGGSTNEEVLIDAFLMAYNDGVDVITSSIGSPGGFADDAWAVVASRIAEQGVFVSIAGGNSGAAGPFYSSTGSSGKHVIGVASVDSSIMAASGFNATFKLDGETNQTVVGYSAGTYDFPSSIIEWPIVALSYDTSDPAEACQPFPEGSPDLTNSIALVRRGTCTFSTKQLNLEALGAKYILFYNNENPITSPGTDDSDSLMGLITAEAGQAIINTLKAGGSVTATFLVDPPIVGLKNIAGGLPSAYTSWGGLFDLSIKPDIAAPGGNIFSTYLDDTYAIMSGTSMACPYIAGVAALYVGAHGGRAKHGANFAKMLNQRIVSSGASLPWSNGSAFTAPVTQVGNGMVNAFKVLQYNTSLSYDKFELNDTSHHFSQYHDIDITNNGPASVSYTFAVEDAAGFEALEKFDPDKYFSTRLNQLKNLIPIEIAPAVQLPSRGFTLKSGETRRARFTFSRPIGTNATALPVYSGKILITGSNGEELSVPYLGLASDLQAEMNPIFEYTYPFSHSGVNVVSFSIKHTYTFNLSLATQDYPIVYAKLKWGTSQLRWDIYEAGWEERSWRYPPVVGEHGYIGAATSYNNIQSPPFRPDTMDSNATFNFPVSDVFRNAQTEQAYHEYWWFGKLANGSQIVNGNYTWRVAALNPFGVPTQSDDWSVWREGYGPNKGGLPRVTIAQP